ncbi:MAG: GNAT family N-acetyltransferase [Acholeplasma sp.]|nr:GNAT family N-acetyltransferase [Acholeplasma sp.]
MDKIVTKRLALRALSMNDCQDVFEYAKLDSVGPQAGWQPHKSLEETKRITEWMISTKEVYGIQHLEDEKIIGTIGLHRKDYLSTEGEIGYVLNPQYWHKGYMHEAVVALIIAAFEQFGIEKLYCAHFSDNEKSMNVIKKAGFKKVKEEIKKITLYGFEIVKTSVKYELDKSHYERKLLPWQQR